MSQTLTILWTPPTPAPGCGYSVAYRANSMPSYTNVNTSASTSGINSVAISGLVPACYEGWVMSNCCKDNYSGITTSVWGINSWMALSVTPYIATPGDIVTFSVTSAYPNPYATAVSGNITVQGAGFSSPQTFSLTYPAGVTSYTTTQFYLVPGAGSSVVLNSLITVPVFDNGGTLQQFDSVNTPQYFQFYSTSGCTSGSTSGCTAPIWNGSPIVLPSFVLRQFTVTAVDVSSNPIAGNLLVQWIQSSVYGGGLGIYSHITFNVYDPGTALMGSITVPYGVPGINYATIHVVKVAAPISTSTQFTMTTQWADTSLSATQVFYLPNF